MQESAAAEAVGALVGSLLVAGAEGSESDDDGAHTNEPPLSELLATL